MRFYELKRQLTESFTVAPAPATSGPAVADIQKALIALGYDLPKHGIDGIRGPETSNAIKEFQKVNQIRVDGVPGIETTTAINAALQKNPAVANTLTKSTVADVKPKTKAAPTAMAPLATDSATQGKIGELLNFIARYESRGNYNIVFGGTIVPELTKMTIVQVYQYQSKMLESGKESTAVGRYQFIKKTLTETVKSLGLDPNTAVFDPATQDALIIHRLRKQRGLDGWLNGTITDEQFLENLAKEFASIPAPSKGGASFYKGVGSNKSLTTLDTAMSALSNINSMA